MVYAFSTYVCSAHSARHKMCVCFTTDLARGSWYVAHSQYFLSIGLITTQKSFTFLDDTIGESG
jgi:hypothetical protein